MASFTVSGQPGRPQWSSTPHGDRAGRGRLKAADGTLEPDGDEFMVRGLGPEQVGELALANGILLHHLAPSRVSLEEAFMELTADSVEYQAKG